MARPRKPPTVQWTILVPQDLAVEVELLLMDPFTQQVKYGARKMLIQRLLREWVREQTTSPDRGEIE